jgi:hypothetical protein
MLGHDAKVHGKNAQDELDMFERQISRRIAIQVEYCSLHGECYKKRSRGADWRQ